MPPSPAVSVIVPGQRAAVAAARDLREALVGALHDALGADVDPRPGGHLPVHRQPEVLEAAELLPRRPLRHEVGVGDQHPRRPLVGAHHADRLARLHEQRLVALERAQRCARSRRRPPTSARRGRCRRRRRARRGARRRRGRGCSSASAARPPAASPCSESSVPRGARTSRGPLTPSPPPPPRRRAARRRSPPAPPPPPGRARGSGPGPGPAIRSRTAASAAAPPGPGCSGARRSSPCAAHDSSTARMRARLASAVRSLRAADQPIET